jgi:tetratricopeptide (TPR) repeat protein
LLGPTLVFVSGVLWWQRNDGKIVPECRDLSAHVSEVWNRERADTARGAFLATQSPIAIETWQKSEASLDDWGERWQLAATHLCPTKRIASGFTPFSPALREQSRVCLEESRAEVATLLEIWRHPSALQVLHAGTALASLSRPEDCTDHEFLLSRAPLPLDPSERRLVIEQRAALKRIFIGIQLGEYQRADLELAAVRSALGEHIDPGIESDYSRLRALVGYYGAGNIRDNAISWLAAIVWSTAANQDAMRSDSISKLWFTRVYRGDRVEEADEIFRSHLATLTRFGKPPRLLAAYERHLAIWAAMHGDFARATELFDRALKHLLDATGEYSDQSAWALDDLGHTETVRGNYAAADGYLREAMKIRNTILPKGHPDRVRTRVELTRNLASWGRPYEALLADLAGWRECYEAAMPRTTCAGVELSTVDQHNSIGQLQAALWDILPLPAIESELGRRIESGQPWIEITMAMVLERRGETLAAAELCAINQRKLEGEGHVAARIGAESSIRSALTALANKDLDTAARELETATELLREPREGHESILLSLENAKAQYALAAERPQQAALILESLLANQTPLLASPLDQSAIHFNFARALLAMNDATLASDYLDRAFNLQRSIDGSSPHVLVRYYQLAAEIALHQGRFGEALAQIELGRLAFDPVEVLDNRLAPFYFLEARAWLGIDRSKNGRKLARRLAGTAKREYEDWDAGAAGEIANIAAWMQRI